MAHHSAVLKTIGDTAGMSLLDVGCGFGVFSALLIGTDYVGIDPDKDAISQARMWFPDREFHATRRLHKADVVVAIGVVSDQAEVKDRREFVERLWKNTRVCLCLTCWDQYADERDHWWKFVGPPLTIDDNGNDFFVQVKYR